MSLFEQNQFDLSEVGNVAFNFRSKLLGACGCQNRQRFSQMRRAKFDRAPEFLEPGVDILPQSFDTGGLLGIIGCKMLKGQREPTEFQLRPD